MNEIIITTTANELGRSNLGKATAFIINSLNTDVKNEKERAIKLHDVDVSGLATKHNPLGEFATTAEWAAKFFGWEKTKVSRYTRIVEKFHENRLTDGNDADVWDNYTISQMVELLKADDEQLKSITADMSVRTIRDKLNMIDADGGDDNTDDNDTGDDNGTGDDNDADDDNDSGDVIDAANTYTEYRRTQDITVLAATIRQFKEVNVEYTEGEYIIFTKATE